mgnify:CR=1 FL=1
MNSGADILNALLILLELIPKINTYFLLSFFYTHYKVYVYQEMIESSASLYS